jgi:hypothetical protein
MHRRFVGCDIGEAALHIAKRRLIAGPEPRPGLDVYAVRGGPALTPAHGLRSGPAMQRLLDWLGAGPTQRPARGTGRRRSGGRSRQPGRVAVIGRIGAADVMVHRGGLALAAAAALRVLLRGGARPSTRLVCCAREFEPGFWERLESAGAAARIFPVCLPPDAQVPGAALESPPSLLPRAAVATRWEDGTVRIRLSGFHAPTLAEALARKPMDTGDGLDAVDLWAVDPDWRPGAPIQAAWFTGRPRTGRWSRPQPVPVDSPALARGTSGWLLVKAWDGLGRAATCVIPADTASEVPAAPRIKGRKGN